MLGEWTEDSTTEILLNLPVKSLVRFKSVSKSWCALFETPHFIRSHLNLSKKCPRLVLDYLDTDERGCEYWRKTLFRDPLDDAPVDLPQLFPGQEFSDVSTQSTLFVCDGLFCFFRPDRDQIYLCNIATRDLLLLPQLPVPSEVSQSRTDYVNPIALGLWVDLISNNYKVLFGRSFDGIRMTPSYWIDQFGIYSSKTGSWRELDEQGRNLKLNWHGLGAAYFSVIDGICYWVDFKRFDRDLFILTFHLDEEVFQEMQMPPTSSYAGQYPMLSDILKHRDHLWLAISYGCLESHEYESLWLPEFHDFWVLNDSGHWTKQFKIGPLSNDISRVYGFWTNGEIFLVSFPHLLFFYDPATGNMKDLDALNAKIFYYEESLVKVLNN